MAAKKKVAKPKGPQSWAENHDEYPTKRGICEFCNQTDDLKLSYDKHRYICLNDHACQLRWIKKRMVDSGAKK